MVQGQQSGCGIGAAAAQTAAHGQPFGDANGDPGRIASNPFQESSGRANDEVVLVGDTGNRLREPHAGLFGREGEAQIVAVVQKLEQGLQLVIAVFRRPTMCRNRLSLAGDGRVRSFTAGCSCQSLTTRRTRLSSLRAVIGRGSAGISFDKAVPAVVADFPAVLADDGELALFVEQQAEVAGR